MGSTVHPPIDHDRGIAHHAPINIFPNPGGIIPLTGNPIPGGGPVATNMAEKGIASHVLTMTVGGSGQCRLNNQGRKPIVDALLIQQDDHLSFETGIVRGRTAGQGREGEGRSASGGNR